MSDTSTVTCEIFANRLMDFLEADLDGATRAALEAHERRCTACGVLAADLRRLSAHAARLPAITPSRDLWSGIEARIAAPVVSLDVGRPRWKSPRILGFGMAAALVFAAALGYEIANRGATPGAPTAPATTQVAARTTPAASGAPGATLAANRRAEATPAAVEKSYATEIAGLRAMLDTRRSHLDSATVAVLEKNLVVIDSAIAQCKTALAKDPASRYLMQSLSQSLDTKVQLLRIAAALPSST
jgi:Putative zinc-finger